MRPEVLSQGYLGASRYDTTAAEGAGGEEEDVGGEEERWRAARSAPHPVPCGAARAACRLLVGAAYSTVVLPRVRRRRGAAPPGSLPRAPAGAGTLPATSAGLYPHEPH